LKKNVFLYNISLYSQIWLPSLPVYHRHFGYNTKNPVRPRRSIYDAQNGILGFPAKRIAETTFKPESNRWDSPRSLSLSTLARSTLARSLSLSSHRIASHRIPLSSN
jgi:hypothetical protein